MSSRLYLVSAQIVEQDIDGVRVCLTQDGAYSCIEVRAPDQPIETIAVPAIDGRGNPSMAGREATLDDLRELAQLRVEFLPVLFRLAAAGGEQALLSVAKRTGLTPPRNDGTFEWLRILRAARLAGKLDG